MGPLVGRLDKLGDHPARKGRRAEVAQHWRAKRHLADGHGVAGCSWGAPDRGCVGPASSDWPAPPRRSRTGYPPGRPWRMRWKRAIPADRSCDISPPAPSTLYSGQNPPEPPLAPQDNVPEDPVPSASAEPIMAAFLPTQVRPGRDPGPIPDASTGPRAVMPHRGTVPVPLCTAHVPFNSQRKM